MYTLDLTHPTVQLHIIYLQIMLFSKINISLTGLSVPEKLCALYYNLCVIEYNLHVFLILDTLGSFLRICTSDMYLLASQLTTHSFY